MVMHLIVGLRVRGSTRNRSAGFGEGHGYPWTVRV